jgi:hypothetical protein
MNEGIRVNTILPGILGTPTLASLSQAVQDSLAASAPFPKRLGAPEEYADLVLFLIGNGHMNTRGGIGDHRDLAREIAPAFRQAPSPIQQRRADRARSAG